MKKHVCQVCGYVYDPSEHDGESFESLPRDYLCPICGASKAEFTEE